MGRRRSVERMLLPRSLPTPGTVMSTLPERRRVDRTLHSGPREDKGATMALTCPPPSGALSTEQTALAGALMCQPLRHLLQNALTVTSSGQSWGKH